MDADVLIVGYGPTGMLAAALLGRAGHRVIVLERHASLYNLPRVGIVHDDVLRMFQDVGIVEHVLPATEFLPKYELARNGKVLLENTVAPEATHGWPEFTSIYQPAFEGALDRLVRSIASVRVLQGEAVTHLTQDDQSITATTRTESGSVAYYRARYLIGSDGGNSFVREALGIAYEDLGFDQNWLVTDLRIKGERRSTWPALRQFCEPEQPGMTMQMGPAHRRYSFMIFADESPADAVTPASVWRRLNRPEGGTPDEMELIRAVSYRFRSLIATRWRVGRALLAGDSAHQMPPFLAQGLCSGFRDAYNLGWKLDLVLRELASPALLDTYEAERAPNARSTIIESARVGQNVIERDPERAKVRDAQLTALAAAQNPSKQLIAFRVPGITNGLIGDTIGAGDLFGQARMRAGASEGRFDDLAGRGFLIIARGVDPWAALDEADRTFWRSIGGRCVRIDGQPTVDAPAIEEITGTLSRLMDEYGVDAIIKRPDFSIYATARTAAELPAVIASLRDRLRAP